MKHRKQFFQEEKEKKEKMHATSVLWFYSEFNPSEIYRININLQYLLHRRHLSLFLHQISSLNQQKSTCDIIGSK